MSSGDYGQIIRDAVRQRNTSLRAVSELLSINYTTARYFINGDHLADASVLNAGELLLRWCSDPTSIPDRHGELLELCMRGGGRKGVCWEASCGGTGVRGGGVLLIHVFFV